MTFGQIIADAKNGLEKKCLPFFSLFEKKFVARISRIPANPPDWQNRDAFMNFENVVCFFGCIIDTLFWQAVALADRAGDQGYRDATEIAEAFRLALENNFNFSIKPIEIMAPSRAMEEEGLVKIVVSADGERCVQLTEDSILYARQFSAAHPGPN